MNFSAILLFTAIALTFGAIAVLMTLNRQAARQKNRGQDWYPDYETEMLRLAQMEVYSAPDQHAIGSARNMRSAK